LQRKNFLLRLWIESALLFGGDWNNAASCGSRSRNANNARSNANANIGGRGAIRRLWNVQTPCIYGDNSG